MALVTISGFPCSGKTTRTRQIAEMLRSRQSLPVVTVTDDDLNLSRDVYDTATSEKAARASLLSAVTRYLSPDRIVIFDGMNYIKGYRYQLYCAAREYKCRTCTIQIAAPADKCKLWNEQRDSNRYTPDTLENLISRYEEPSPFVRWDSPLITIPWSDTNLPEDEVYNAVFSSELRPPTQATASAPTSTTDYLTLLDTIAAAVIQALLSAQNANPGGGQTTFTVSPTTADGINVSGKGSEKRLSIQLPLRTVTMPQLQRAKRQFIVLQRQGRDELPSESIAELFAKYLEDALN